MCVCACVCGGCACPWSAVYGTVFLSATGGDAQLQAARRDVAQGPQVTLPVHTLQAANPTNTLISVCQLQQGQLQDEYSCIVFIYKLGES